MQWVRHKLNIILPLLQGTFVLTPTPTPSHPHGGEGLPSPTKAAGEQSEGANSSGSSSQGRRGGSNGSNGSSGVGLGVVLPWRLRQVERVELPAGGGDEAAAAAVVLVGGGRVRAGDLGNQLLQDLDDHEVRECVCVWGGGGREGLGAKGILGRALPVSDHLGERSSSGEGVCVFGEGGEEEEWRRSGAEGELDSGGHCCTAVTVYPVALLCKVELALAFSYNRRGWLALFAKTAEGWGHIHSLREFDCSAAHPPPVTSLRSCCWFCLAMSALALSLQLLLN